MSQSRAAWGLAATGRAGETYRQLAEGPMTGAALFPGREVDECEVAPRILLTRAYLKTRKCWDHELESGAVNGSPLPSVQRHPPYAHFEAQDWRRVERILDRGEWIEQPDGRRLLWIVEDRKPWTAVVKRTGNDEVYLQSYRRANRRDVARWEGR